MIIAILLLVTIGYEPDAKLTSRLNSTPPIGDPKATEMPAAAAADNTSRFRAVTCQTSRETTRAHSNYTFIAIDISKQLHE
jgi:hypothetical protein